MLDMQPDLKRLSGVLDALSNGARIRMIEYLLLQGESDVSTMVREIGLSQSALSQHLRVMYNMSIVRFRKKSQFRYYSICEGMDAILSNLIEIAYSHSDRRLDPSKAVPEEPSHVLKTGAIKAAKRRLVLNRKGHPLWRR